MRAYPLALAVLLCAACGEDEDTAVRSSRGPGPLGPSATEGDEVAENEGATVPGTSPDEQAEAPEPATPALSPEAQLFVGNLWVMGQAGELRYSIDPSDDGATAEVCEGAGPCADPYEDGAVVSVEGRRIRITGVHADEGPDLLLELDLSEDERTLTVHTFSLTANDRRPVEPFRRADGVERTLIAMGPDINTAVHGGELPSYQAVVAQYDAIRRGIVAAGRDPFEIDVSAVLEIEGDLPDPPSACRRVRSRPCRAHLESVVQSVAEALGPGG